jgi:hypothetical protein
MLELIVLAQEAIAEGTFEEAAAMVPHTSFAFNTDGVLKGTGTGVGLQTLAAVADPRFAEIANSTHHPCPSSVNSWVLYNTISSLQHALDLSTLSANWQSLNTLAEITKRSTFLLPMAFLTFHC